MVRGTSLVVWRGQAGVFDVGGVGDNRGDPAGLGGNVLVGPPLKGT